MIESRICFSLFLSAVLCFIAFVSTAEHAGFKTEPTFAPEVLHIKERVQNESLLAPGYIFLDPLVRNWGYGPQIYTQSGELVWYGNSTAFSRVQDFKTCDYRGQRGNHLCWHAAKSRRGHTPIGYKVVFDNTYSQVGQNYSTAGNNSYPNTHEFRMVEHGNAFLQTVFEPRQMDLTPYMGPKNGWVFDGCFQEIETEKGNIVFQWCYLQSNLPVWETRLFMTGQGQKNISSKNAGLGTFDSPWDFIHLNSIDKNSEGDYLISSRYFDQILKIAGRGNAHGVAAGTVIWRLGGVANQFKKDFNFSRQHSVRYLQTESSGDTLAILDNAWDGITPASASESSGKIIRVNNQTADMTANLVEQFPSPQNKLVKAQGGIQPLPNGNILIGWGVRPEISEFSPNGELLYHARFQHYSYRAFKDLWIGKPHWGPKLLSYKQSCGTSPLHVYVSWNGATEVAYWKFQVGPTETGPWDRVRTYPKGSGFETHALFFSSAEVKKLQFGFPRYVRVEALDSNFTVLNSVVSATFVPSSSTRSKHKCSEKACEQPVSFLYDKKHSIAASTCGKGGLNTIATLLVFLTITESLDMLYLFLFSKK